jgi:hypothetical protein
MGGIFGDNRFMSCVFQAWTKYRFVYMRGIHSGAYTPKEAFKL